MIDSPSEVDTTAIHYFIVYHFYKFEGTIILQVKKNYTLITSRRPINSHTAMLFFYIMFTLLWDDMFYPIPLVIFLGCTEFKTYQLSVTC